MAQSHRRNGPPPRDRHRLYELAVQCPEADVQFFDRVYKSKRGKPAKVLKEDFCGTAAIAAEWVRKRRGNIAIGVDLDQETLDWGQRYNIEPLGKAAQRVKLICDDVRSVHHPKADLIVGQNFSYFVFKTRDELRGYFENVRKSLATDGVLILDIFGGSDSQSLDIEEKDVEPEDDDAEDFIYIWDQVSHDAITHSTRFDISFRFEDGREMKRAFTYDWRLWSIPEVRETLIEAGFAHTEVYWEGTDHETGDGNGVFRRAERVQNCPGWIAYIVAT
jgi:SAM-dependent methyltransferase